MPSISKSVRGRALRPYVALPYSFLSGAPFCDFLNVSVPIDFGNLLMRALHPVLDQVGACEQTGCAGLWNIVACGGTFKYRRRGSAAIISASGAALQALRERRLFADYLSIIGEYPHRVTMLHATADYFLDAPPLINSVYASAKGGAIQLTRKAIALRDVRAFLAQDLSGSGLDTGTVYLGNRHNSDVWAKVYDKRQEMVSKGRDDPGPLIRVEVAVKSEVGATLRDAQDPRALFFRYAGPALVQRPKDCGVWVPRGEGFTSAPRREVLMHARLVSRMDASADFAYVCVRALEEWGQAGRAILAHMIEARFDQAFQSAVLSVKS
jgi:hypothetical protein